LIEIRRAAPEQSGSIFNNPKTNLTYEKNLYILLSKYRAKSFTKINIFHKIKNIIT
jgi:hypothetical protein